MHATIPKEKSTYETDTNLDYYDSDLELCKDYIWMFEHSNEIIDLIKMSKDQQDMIVALKDKVADNYPEMR